MSYSLRPYQQKCADFVLEELKKNTKDPILLNLSTAFGKSWLIADIAKRSGLKTLILTISKELCEQDYAKLNEVMEGQDIGMYSASWGRKETEYITVATVQSAHKHPELWEDYGLVIADEVDASFSLDGMFGHLIKGKKVIGLSGTCYGTVGSKTGNWFTTKIWPLHKIKSSKFGWFWKPVAYNVSEKQLLDEGYLCPLKLFSSPIECGRLKVNSNGSEYTLESINDWVSHVYGRIIEVMKKAEETGMCHTGIVFMPSVDSCEALERLCETYKVNARAVHSKTPSKTRDEVIEAHKRGELTWLINMGVATRGFDNPAVDCLVIARPTKSLRLHRQILGRALRLSEGKKLGYVLDLTNNCKTWGGPEDVIMGKNGWQDTILLKGKDISGMEVSKINLKEQRNKRVDALLDAETNNTWSRTSGKESK